MKNFWLVIISLFASVMTLSAQVSTSKNAARIARSAKSGSKMELVYTQMTKNGDSPAFYVFSRGENEGIVIVSALEGDEKILGYTDAGNFDEDAIPDGMKDMFMYYADQVMHCREARTIDGEYVAMSASSRRNVQHRADTTYQRVDPLLGMIMWGQGEPFNRMTPKDGNKHCLTGCAATATAQIMRYWKHPAQGKGSYSYTCYSLAGRPVVSANFSESVYDWANMIPNYNGRYSNTEGNAVAKLMSDVGIACNMSYRADASSTYGSYAMNALITYFDYDKSIYGLCPDYCGMDYFEDKVREELYAKRPIMLGGENVNHQGHAFVCDGMDEQGLFHINWGFSGQGDGYFAMNVLNPGEGMGEMGAIYGGGFNVSVQAYLGIQPNKNYERSKPEIGVQSVNMLTKSRVAKTDTVVVEYPVVVSTGLTGWTGCFGLGLYQNDSLLDWLYGLWNTNPALVYGFSIGGKLPFVPADIKVSDQPIANGKYELRPVYTIGEDFSTTRLLPVSKYSTDYKIGMEVTNDSVFFTVPDYEITEIDVAVNGGSVRFSWEGHAPFYSVQVYNAQGKTQCKYVCAHTTYKISDLPNGTYKVAIAALDETMRRNISNWAWADFEIVSSGLEQMRTVSQVSANGLQLHVITSENQTTVVYDILGQKVAETLGTDVTISVPNHGTYIIRVGEDVRKIVL